jgi:hypothetical protein
MLAIWIYIYRCLYRNVCFHCSFGLHDQSQQKKKWHDFITGLSENYKTGVLMGA